MGLEDEIKKTLWRAVAGDAKSLEALVSGSEVAVSTEDLIRIVIAKQQALEDAVLRIARHIDES